MFVNYTLQHSGGEGKLWHGAQAWRVTISINREKSKFAGLG